MIIQVITSVTAPLFVYQYIVFIIITALLLLSLLLTYKKYRNHMVNKLFRGKYKPNSAIYLVARIAQIVGLFILISNVVVMEAGKKNCPSCSINTTFGIVCAYIFMIYYFLVLIFFTYTDFAKMMDKKNYNL